MKITINANITPETINSYLEKQYQKKEKIIDFCKKKNIQELQYKDSELEFDFAEVSKMAEVSKPKVEARPKQANKEIRKVNGADK